MHDPSKTNQQLIEEIFLLKQKIRELEAPEVQRKRAEREITRGDSKYQQLVEHAQDGIFTINVQGRFILANEKFCQMIGCTHEECLRCNILDTYPEDMQTIGRQRLDDLKCGDAIRFEHPMKRKDGDIVYVSVNAWKDEDGNLQAIVRDITERKRMEESLRQSEERYRNIIDNIDDGYYEIDLSGNFTFVNDEICNHLGYTREEIIGMNDRKYTDEATSKELYRHYLELHKTGKKIKKYAFEIIRKDGTRGFSEISVALIKDAWGNPVGFRGISRDVTERKQMEEIIRQSEERYRTIIEQMEDGYFETDLRGNFTFVNDAECRNLGYTQEELIGMNRHQYADEKNARILFEVFNGVYRTGIPVKAHDLELIRKDGTRNIDEISVALIRNAKGEPMGFRGIARDVSERRRMEEKLRSISITDELTGLYNRRGFISLSEQQIKIAKRARMNMLLFFADLDKLKQINDTFGHQEGDNAIVEGAAVLREVFRESDIIGRIGGDEFAVLTTNTTEETRELLTMRIHDILDAHNRFEGRHYHLSFSIGVAHYNSEATGSLDDLMVQADTLMYQEKKNKKC
ncbi:MAG: PAS domain S-box protein [Smithella sp.]